MADIDVRAGQGYYGAITYFVARAFGYTGRRTRGIDEPWNPYRQVPGPKGALATQPNPYYVPGTPWPGEAPPTSGGFTQGIAPQFPVASGGTGGGTTPPINPGAGSGQSPADRFPGTIPGGPVMGNWGVPDYSMVPGPQRMILGGRRVITWAARQLLELMRGGKPQPRRIPRRVPRRRPPKRANPARPTPRPGRRPRRVPRPRVRPGQPVIPVIPPMFPTTPGTAPTALPGGAPTPSSPPATRPGAPPGSPPPGTTTPGSRPNAPPNVPMPTPGPQPGQSSPTTRPSPAPAARPGPARWPSPGPAPAPAPKIKWESWLLPWLLNRPAARPALRTSSDPWRFRFSDGGSNPGLTPNRNAGVGYLTTPVTQGNPCSETARDQRRRKRKKRKERTVCYQGTYTELASGLIKRRKRKVPCRASKKRPALRPVP